MMKMSKYDTFEILHYVIYFVVQIVLYFYSIFQLQEMNSVWSYIFIYSFPFLFFYEGLYLKDKEFNYAQIVKLLLLIFLSNKNNISLIFSFTFFNWSYSICKNIFYMQQEYSTCKNGEKIIKIIKKNLIYYLFNLVAFSTIFIYFRYRLFESFIIFGIYFFYFVILFSKSITFFPHFDFGMYNKHYFIPSSKIRYIMIDKLANIHLDDFLFIIPILGGFLYLQNDLLTIYFISTFGLIYVFQKTKNYISVYGRKLLKLHIIPLVIQFFLSFLFLYVLNNFKNVETETIEQIYNMIVSIISADLIFNFTAMFILLQENYNKYNSVYLLKNIVTKNTIFLTIIIPTSFIIVLILEIIPEKYFVMYSIFCICSCISLSIWLLNSLKKSLNIVDVIKGLMSNTDSESIRDYCNSNFDDNSNDIDTILKITIDSISKKEYTVLKYIFELDLNWIEKYRKEISISSYSPYFESQNKFYSFIDILTTCIAESKSQVIIKHFSEEVYRIFRTANIKEEYKEYHIFYNALQKLISKILNINDSDLENSSIQLFNTYFYNIGELFLNLEYTENEDLFYVIESESYREFKNYYYSPMNKIIRKAVKKQKITFLKNLDLLSRFFQIPENKKLNINHKENLLEIVSLYAHILQNTDYNNELLNSIFSDYESIIHYLSYLKMSNKLSVLMNNITLNGISGIYINLLKKKHLFTEFDLKLLYSYFFDRKQIHSNAIGYLNLFCFVVSEFFDYGSDKIEKNLQNQIWTRVVQLKTIFEEENNLELLNCINQNINKIIKKHPNIDKEYKKYMEQINNELEELKSFQEKFNKKYN